MMEFLDMGGKAAFVWPAYGISALALAALVYASWRRLRIVTAQLARLEGDRK